MKRTNLGKLIALSSIISLLVACNHMPINGNLSSKNEAQIKLQSIIDEDWHYYQKLSEQRETEGSATPLAVVTPEYQEQIKSAAEARLAKLNTISIDTLTRDEIISLKLLKRKQQTTINYAKNKNYHVPFTSEWGFVQSLDQTLSQTEVSDAKSLRHYAAMIADIPRYLEEHKANMIAGMARQFMAPKVIAKMAIIPIERHANWKSAKESSFYQHIQDYAPKSEAETQLLKNIASTIDTQVIPAFKSLQQFMKEEYLPAAPTKIAATLRNGGKSFYQDEIKNYTTLDLTPDQIHEIGLKEVARIRQEMEQVIKASGFKGDFKSFIHFLRTDPKFYAKTEKDLLKEAAYISKKADGVLPKYFTKFPRQPYAVNPVPAEIAPYYTTGRYVGADLDSKRPGQYWVNTYALDKRPLYVLEALTLHEAVPGHHFQIALTKELSHLPKFRQQGYISAFGEGWALYCEYLGIEAGFYQDPYSQFGRLTYEMWRAIRLVVDTGMHAKGWTRQQSIDYMENNTALSKHNVRTEIDRYISWPAQALSYKLGEIKIKELRTLAEKELGDQFDIRLFHDEILKYGAVSLDILEENIRFWIQQVKGSSNS